ncbi:LPS assembly lipoprotein LptE [Thauera linaloolentis]|uniref:LPS-assembly lipoprotein LptE n=1 Tax=Thauera linaloolentis (strain DSM 12138 / JCM 21573 / CCUG 41526 / CIP 105981 / IAM 15112 / NBRC 102519 / 47Lol) TaxID=1123367 RepID=N6Z5P5_THAL4|nr:LPS assembly lipoprotein LptE [Thauera linaloolentis]ENO89733.1 Rare lipoprotein B [Thauera linaloolentis 47Lol = DSM 12138]MCM8566031.1 LPS assembly lipoprotein LptE [Thauera linaloolentis]
MHRRPHAATPPHAASPATICPPARRRLLLGTAGLAGLLLTGCGFKLRGPQRLDFATVHINTSELSELGASLRRLIATSGSTTVVDDPAQADARLQILADNRGREILSLTGAGKVREYQLTQILRFQLLDKGGKALIPPTTISASREFTFDDSQVLGKEQEETLLYNDMQQDLLQQLMRRLASVQRTD